MTAIGKTKEEAIEAWNTWLGRYKRPDPEAFRRANNIFRYPNPAQMHDMKQSIEAGNPGAEDILFGNMEMLELFGNMEMLEDGTFNLPWPRLSPFHRSIEGFRALELFQLRTRWLYALDDTCNYEAFVHSLLQAVGSRGVLFDAIAKQYNPKLSAVGLPLIDGMDLRGINIAGLSLAGPAFQGLSLRGVDLSFAELSLVELDGANLYGAKLEGVHASHANLRHCILVSANLRHAFMPSVDVSGSDLSFADLSHSVCHRAAFDGVEMNGTDISGAQLTDISMRAEGSDRTRLLSVTSLKFDSHTKLTWRLPPPSLAGFPTQFAVPSGATRGGFLNTVAAAIGIRPSFLGISIDLKSIASDVLRWLRARHWW